MSIKKFGKRLISGLVAGTILLSSSGVYASDAIKLGATWWRENTEKKNDTEASLIAYKSDYVNKDSELEELRVWKLVEQLGDETTINYEKAIYCLKAGVGFTGMLDANTYTTNGVDYNQKYNMYDKEQIKTAMGWDDATYNKVLWIIDNMYVQNISEATMEELLKSIVDSESKSIYDRMNATETILDDLTKNDIEVVQQMAIWYFTNSEDSKYHEVDLETGEPKFPSLTVSMVDSLSNIPTSSTELRDSFETFADLYNTQIGKQSEKDAGTHRQKYAEELYKYLIMQAEANSSDYTHVDDGTRATFWIHTDEQGNITTGEDERQPVVIIERPEFDLALRKYITTVSDGQTYKNTYYRVPEIEEEQLQKLANSDITTVEKKHDKTPVIVHTGDIVTYTIRIYNEGNISGYANEVTDYLPSGLEFLEDSTINKQYKWKCYDGKTVTTDYLEDSDNLINAFDKENLTLDYVDLQIECKVTAQKSTVETKLRNVAEITKAKDINGNDMLNEGDDRDSTPNKNMPDSVKTNSNEYNSNTPDEIGTGSIGWGYEDDDDFDDLILSVEELDLALRKFITAVGNTEIKNREPEVITSTISSTGTATYNHTKVPLTVKVGDIVTYTIRVYNEGDVDGYVSEITDHLPEWLDYLPTDETNLNYGWAPVTDSDGNIDLKTIKTDITAKQGSTTELGNNLYADRTNGKLLKAWDGTVNSLDYIDVKIKCVVNENAVQGIKITNIAEITGMTDAENNVITGRVDGERDSDVNNIQIPEALPEYRDNEINAGDEYIEGQQDDDDFEKVVVQAFDLRLRKFITGVEETKTTQKTPKLIIGSQERKIEEFYSLLTATEEHYENVLKEEVMYVNINPEKLNDEKDFGKINFDNLIVDGINKEGNSILVFIGNNTVENGDEIIVEDKNGKIGIYTVNNIEEIGEETDLSGLLEKDTNGKTEITIMVAENKEIKKGSLVTATLQELKETEKVVELKEITDRYPVVTKLENPTVATNPLNYAHPKIEEPVPVVKGDVVIYTLRIFNEGDVAGYAEEITDYLEDEGLKFLPEHSTNTKYGWKMIDENGNETTDVSKAVKVVTDYLSYKNDPVVKGIDGAQSTLIRALNRDNNVTDNDVNIDYEDWINHQANAQNPDYRDVQIAFEVVEENESERILENTAEISDDAGENGEEVTDIDSDPDRIYNNEEENEDDYDKDYVKLTCFDLALRKFITDVDGSPVNNRYPVPTWNDTLKRIVYNHPKTPVEVVYGDVVTYTIRVYNEGTIDGFAEEITDDLPEYLTFLPDHEINKEYGWVMRDEFGVEVTDVEDAVRITTDYLSKANGEPDDGSTLTDEQGNVIPAINTNLIKAFNKEAGITGENPDYREIKVAMRVDLQITGDNMEDSNRVLINEAQISEDADAEGNIVEDVDSEPARDDEYNYDGDNEDDIDYEPVKVKYFDLALKKWITQSIVTENGKTTVTESGHTGEENPESPMKVELRSKYLKTSTVKFRFKIKVTNQGEIAGYATEVTDHIPEGLEFAQADNPGWYERGDGLVATDALKTTLLQPGESATVEIVLTWTKGNNNFGLKTNYAEISQDDNASNTPDIDSDPDNFTGKVIEDDEDEAPVVLSIKTGQIPMYFLLTGVIIGMLAGGVLLIKKYVI